jgi:CRP-like cAMP-binding protein
MARNRVGKDRRIDLLQQVWLFSKCTRKELSRIAEIAAVVDVESGRVLVKENTPGQEFFVVISGSALVSREGAALGTVEAGSFFGEMALLDGGPRVATVTAAEPMELLVMTRTEFGQLLNEVVPAVAQRMLTVLGARLRSAEAVEPSNAELGRRDGLPTGV